jgi:lipopolysaccharide/colanic/teichoic acid biosynthesis glycosyltransferase
MITVRTNHSAQRRPYVHKDCATTKDRFAPKSVPDLTPQDETRPESFYERRGKRYLDVVLVLVSLPLTLLIIFVSAVIVASDGHNPFFVQRRIGRGGRVFNILKLRTMEPNADALLLDHLAADPSALSEWSAHQKLKSDPRITRFGTILRKTSFDELPQIFNVLRGDMSLVGPRPMMVNQLGLYSGRAYFRLRPGLTGFWQVSDRNESEFDGRTRHDENYAKSISLWTDIKVIAQTLGVVISGTGY